MPRDYEGGARAIDIADVGPVTVRERADVALVGLGETPDHALVSQALRQDVRDSRP